MARLSLVLAILLAVGLVAPGTAGIAEAVRTGAEFQVNSFTFFGQSRPAVASGPDGGFVVVWQSYAQDGEAGGVFAAHFSSVGTPISGDVPVNTYTFGTQQRPAVSIDGDGDFVVVWQSRHEDGSSEGVFARVFSSTGYSYPAFAVNQYTIDSQSYASVSADLDGDFVVAWESFEQDGNTDGTFARRFSSNGEPLVGEFQVATRTGYNQIFPRVESSSNGDFAVAFTHDGGFQGTADIFVRRFTSAGAALGAETLVHTYTKDHQFLSSVDRTADGRFVVTWITLDQYGAREKEVMAQRLSSSGTKLGTEFQVNTYTLSSLSVVASVATDAAGDFVVVWTSLGQDGSGYGIFAQVFDSAGERVGIEFQVNTYTAGSQNRPEVASDQQGNFVVVWQSPHDGYYNGIFAQRFRVPSETLDADDDGEASPLTDGLLVLRWMFDFAEDALVAGAVDEANCLRCDANSIESYLLSVAAQLDIDGNGEADPLTDGLLVLRWLFDFTGNALVNGAVAADCTRCDPTSIADYLETLGP